jgi:methionyl-tRNA formyltransferase
VNWAVLKGETETGATLHEMVEKPDAGRLVGQARVAIGPEETAAEVFAKVTSAAESVLKECLGPLLDGSMKFKEQDLRLGSYFGGRKPEDGRIDWSKSAQEIHNLVRAVAPPYPGAFTDFEGRRLKILRSRVEKGTNPPGGTNPAGQKGPYRRGEEWFGACGDGKVLRLLDVELENK